MITLTAHDLCWINGDADDPSDYCAHGKVEFRVNESVFIKPEDGEWTVSGAALYLLRTLTYDHTLEDPVAEGNLLFPCCAFNVYPIQEKFEVVLSGCPNGIDIAVRHSEGRVHLTAGERVEIVTELEWKSAVLTFARQIEEFYTRCSPKAEIDDEYERQGWAAFWREWRERVDTHPLRSVV